MQNIEGAKCAECERYARCTKCAECAKECISYDATAYASERELRWADPTGRVPRLGPADGGLRALRPLHPVVLAVLPLEGLEAAPVHSAARARVSMFSLSFILTSG